MELTPAEKFSILHFLAVQLFYLGCCFMLCIAGRIGWTVWKKKWPSLKSFALGLRVERKSGAGELIMAGNFNLKIVFAVALGFVAGYYFHAAKQGYQRDSFRSGYEARELEQFKNTYPLYNLRVVSRHGNTFSFQKESRTQRPIGEPFALTFCPSFVPRFEPGNFVEELIYEERGDCENIAYPQLGFIMERDENNKPVTGD